MVLDEYVEFLNRDIKQVCSGYQIKISIFKYFKEYFYFIDVIKYIDMINEIKNRKGIYKYLSYKKDVLKIVNELFEIFVFSEIFGRILICRVIVCLKNLFIDVYKKLLIEIFRYVLILFFCCLRNKYI